MVALLYRAPAICTHQLSTKQLAYHLFNITRSIGIAGSRSAWRRTLAVDECLIELAKKRRSLDKAASNDCGRSAQAVHLPDIFDNHVLTYVIGTGGNDMTYNEDSRAKSRAEQLEKARSAGHDKGAFNYDTMKSLRRLVNEGTFNSMSSARLAVLKDLKELATTTVTDHVATFNRSLKAQLDGESTAYSESRSPVAYELKEGSQPDDCYHLVVQTPQYQTMKDIIALVARADWVKHRPAGVDRTLFLEHMS